MEGKLSTGLFIITEKGGNMKKTSIFLMLILFQVSICRADILHMVCTIEGGNPSFWKGLTPEEWAKVNSQTIAMSADQKNGICSAGGPAAILDKISLLPGVTPLKRESSDPAKPAVQPVMTKNSAAEKKVVEIGSVMTVDKGAADVNAIAKKLDSPFCKAGAIGGLPDPDLMVKVEEKPVEVKPIDSAIGEGEAVKK